MPALILLTILFALLGGLAVTAAIFGTDSRPSVGDDRHRTSPVAWRAW